MINLGNKSNKWLIGFTIAVAFMINSCDYSYIEGLDNIQPYTYSPVMAAPLINSSLGIDDIIGSANFDALHIDDEGLIWLVFRGSVPTVTPYDIISFPDQAGSFTFQLHPATIVQPLVIEREFQFQLGATVELNSIKLLSGILNLGITAPALQAAGYGLSSTFEIVGSETVAPTPQPISGIATLQALTRVNLAGNTININPTGNFITIRHTITLSGSGNPAGAPFNVTINKSFNNLEYEIITGYLGTTTFPIGGTTITLDIFENLGLEQTTIEAPRVEVVAANSYGVPFDITVNQFVARNTAGNTINIDLPPLYNPWRLGRANLPGDTSITLSNLHRDNSNLGEIAAINPNQYTYIVTGTANPGGRQINFIRHNSTLNLDLEIMVPMWGRVASFEIDDTISNPLDTIPQEVEWAELSINIDNGLPINAYLQVYFADSLGNIIDSLFTEMGTQNFIEAAPANPATGIANEKRHKNIRIMLEQSKIESLRNATDFIVAANLMTFNQQNNQSVKILYTNKLDIRIGARIKAAVNLDL